MAQFLWNDFRPGAATTQRYSVADAPVILRAVGLGSADTIQIEVRVLDDAGSSNWAVLRRNGVPVVLSGTNNLLVEAVPGEYRVSVPHASPFGSPIAITAETQVVTIDSVRRQNNNRRMLLWNGQARGAPTNSPSYSVRESSLSVTAVGLSSGDVLQVQARLRAPDRTGVAGFAEYWADVFVSGNRLAMTVDSTQVVHTIPGEYRLAIPGPRSGPNIIVAAVELGDTVRDMIAQQQEAQRAATNLAASSLVLPSRTISAGAGLTGGGDLSANRTISLAASGAAAGVYGSTTHVPVLTIDSLGRVTGVSNVLAAVPAAATSTPVASGVSGAVGTSVDYARADHRHAQTVCTLAWNGGTRTLTLTSGTMMQIVEPSFWGSANLASTAVTVSVEAPSADLTVTVGSTSGTITAGSGRRSVTLTTAAGDTGNINVKIAKASGSGVTFGRVKAEIGAFATLWRARGIAAETVLAQRYFQLLPTWFGSWWSNSTTQATCSGPFPVPMRAIPTATLISGVSGCVDPGVQFRNVTAVTFSSASPTGGYVDITTEAVGANQRPCMITGSMNTHLSAEL